MPTLLLLWLAMAQAAPAPAPSLDPPTTSETPAVAPGPVAASQAPVSDGTDVDTDTDTEVDTDAPDLDTDPPEPAVLQRRLPIVLGPALEPGRDAAFVGPFLPDPETTTPAEPVDAVPVDTEPEASAQAPDDPDHDTDVPHGGDVHDTDAASHHASDHATDTDAGHAPQAPPAADGPPPGADAPPPWVGEVFAEAVQRLDERLPSLPLRSWRWAVLLALSSLVLWFCARALDPVRDLLAPAGLLPSAVSASQQLLRVIALFFALGVLAAAVPPSIEPALPFVVLAGALAVGWSARDLLPDFIASIVLTAERKTRPGRWISTGQTAGVVEQVTPRVTWVRDATGRRVALPNRTLLSQVVITDRGQWPTVEIDLRVPEGKAPSTVRRVLEDAVLVSPWAAPVPPEMIREEQEPGRWRVRARVLEGRFADRFEGGLREHVEEVLERGESLRQ